MNTTFQKLISTTSYRTASVKEVGDPCLPAGGIPLIELYVQSSPYLQCPLKGVPDRAHVFTLPVRHDSEFWLESFEEHL